MASQFSSELWNDGIKLVSFCPVCEIRYNPMEARLLVEQGETHLLHVQCRKCQHSILVIVLVNQVGVSSVGLLTDLSYDDVVRVKSGSWVSVDDVIEAHRLFQSANWEQELGRAAQEQVRHVMERRERKQQESKATR